MVCGSSSGIPRRPRPSLRAPGRTDAARAGGAGGRGVARDGDRRCGWWRRRRPTAAGWGSGERPARPGRRRRGRAWALWDSPMRCCPALWSPNDHRPGQWPRTAAEPASADVRAPLSSGAGGDLRAIVGPISRIRCRNPQRDGHGRHRPARRRTSCRDGLAVVGQRARAALRPRVRPERLRSVISSPRGSQVADELRAGWSCGCARPTTSSSTGLSRCRPERGSTRPTSARHRIRRPSRHAPPRTTKPAWLAGLMRYRYGDSNPGFRRERAAS